MAETVGDRIVSIRQALGSMRDPLALEKLSALVRDQTGHFIDKSELSRMERGKQGVSLDDIDALAAVDPLKRGRAWLAWGEAPREAVLPPPAEVATQGPVSSGLRAHKKPTKRRGTA